MPELSRFYGVVIKMYFQQSEHNPPHVHALYDNTYMGAIDIQTLELMEGDLPARALRMVREWIELHREELLHIWKTQEFAHLPPLE